MTEKKSYLNLKEEVWDKDICSGCGACVAVCPADSLFFKDGAGIAYPSSNGFCKQETEGVPCGACYAVCPRTNSIREGMLGSYLRITGAKATFEIPHKQSGGAVTALLMASLQDRTLDGVITISEDRWTHRPYSVLITNSGELIEYAGTRYNWNVPILKALKTAVIDKKLRHLAIVGTPCVTSAARMMKESDHDLVKPFGKAIRCIIGLFCTESFDYHILMNTLLNERDGVSSEEIIHMDVKGKLDLTLADGTMRSVSLKEIDEAVRPGCSYCHDFTALDSDISAGSVGSSEGLTTLMIRNQTGEMILQKALRSNMLDLNDQVDISQIERLAKSKNSR